MPLSVYEKILDKQEKTPKEIIIESLIGKGTCLSYLKTQYPKEILKLLLKILINSNDKKSYAYSLLALGWSFMILKDFKESIKFFKIALDVGMKIGEFPIKGWALNNLGIAYSELGKWKEALIYHERAMELRIENNDKFHQLRSKYNIAYIYFKQNDFNKIISHANEYYE